MINDTFMVAEDLHTWLCVRVISRFEAEFGYAWKETIQQLVKSKGKLNAKKKQKNFSATQNFKKTKPKQNPV